MKKGLPAYYTAEDVSEFQPSRLVYLLVISVALHVCILWFVEYPLVSSITRITNQLSVTFKPNSSVQIIRQNHLATSAKIVNPQAVIKTIPDKPQVSAVQLVTRSLEQVRSFEEKTLTMSNMSVIDERVIKKKIASPISIFSHASEAIQYQLTDGNTWIKMKSIFGGYQCFVVRPADPLESFDQGAWYMTRC